MGHIEMLLMYLLNYRVEVVHDLPGAEVPLETIYYPDASREGGKDGLLVKISPCDASAWLGVFAFGSVGFTGVLSCPDPWTVCVVSRGDGYFVQTNRPDEWSRVACYPITDVRPVSDVGILVFANYTGLVAYGADGLRWRTSRLSYDGLKLGEISGECLRGLAWDAPSGTEVEFVVNLRTGSHIGGADVT